ncbi:MAG: SH3 domain-containing protein [Chloroflexi bacterium]|nr:SH3 domain-containing protein [Ardenticatenaceae bacterium]MBL1128620.1 hypothetical protein [Chloroflexota bacterium]NOG34699.1 SH3 domain-containing protein [Chloroflexota bacterium]GIK55091.1 MAG: hypothetical protein BroJett015_07540 [Chloroflexota bacterium]
MSTALQDGIDLLEKAGHDKQILGMALISLHGALEGFFREQLSTEIAHYENRTGKRSGWQDLIELWESKHHPLSQNDKNTILSKNTLRNKVAHAQPYTINRTEIEQYARFVQDFIGIRLAPSRRTASPTFDNPLPTPESTKRPIGWIIFVAVGLIITFISFLIWNGWLTSLILTGVVFLPLWRRQWLRTTYAYLGGMTFGFVQTVMGFSLMIAIAGALCWPVTWGAIYLLNPGTDDFDPAILLESFAVNEDQNKIRPLPLVEGERPEERPATAVTPPRNANTPQQLEVVGNSNVRAEPNTNADIIGVAPDGELYDILAASQGNTWYKIRLSSGQEGWIGSSRVTLVTPSQR